MKTQLLIIDPQNDFCDLPETWHPVDPIGVSRTAPSLPVPGAHADMQRLAALLREAGAAFDAVTITLDAHHQLDIAHPAFWQTRMRLCAKDSFLSCFSVWMPSMTLIWL